MGRLKRMKSSLALKLHVLQSYVAMIFIKEVMFVLLCFLGKSQYFSVPGMNRNSGTQGFDDKINAKFLMKNQLSSTLPKEMANGCLEG